MIVQAGSPATSTFPRRCSEQRPVEALQALWKPDARFRSFARGNDSDACRSLSHVSTGVAVANLRFASRMP
jgi:hypothetical protein